MRIFAPALQMARCLVNRITIFENIDAIPKKKRQESVIPLRKIRIEPR